MLNDFLVLGQIPGTKIQITFKELLIGVAMYLFTHMIIKVLSVQKLHSTTLKFQTKDGQQLSLL